MNRVGYLQVDVCSGCSNNPVNGGSGTCCCALPYIQPTPLDWSVSPKTWTSSNVVDSEYIYVKTTDMCNAILKSAEEERLKVIMDEASKGVQY